MQRVALLLSILERGKQCGHALPLQEVQYYSIELPAMVMLGLFISNLWCSLIGNGTTAGMLMLACGLSVSIDYIGYTSISTCICTETRKGIKACLYTSVTFDLWDALCFTEMHLGGFLEFRKPPLKFYLCRFTAEEQAILVWKWMWTVQCNIILLQLNRKLIMISQSVENCYKRLTYSNY